MLSITFRESPRLVVLDYLTRLFQLTVIVNLLRAAMCASSYDEIKSFYRRDITIFKTRDAALTWRRAETTEKAKEQ